MSKENPQLEDGHFKISNSLWEYIMASDISKEEFKVVCGIIRQTYGWHRTEASISYSMFEVMTALDRRHIARAINSLLEKELISRNTGAKMKYGKPVYKYRLLKNHWCQYGNSTIANRATEAIANRATNKDIKYKLNIGRKDLVDKFSMRGNKPATNPVAVKSIKKTEDKINTDIPF